MLEIVLTPKILGPPEIGALRLSLFSLMANPRLHAMYVSFIFAVIFQVG